ncbi:MAG: DUF3048 domain-containing protein [Bacilli bacterium]
MKKNKNIFKKIKKIKLDNLIIGIIVILIIGGVGIYMAFSNKETPERKEVKETIPEKKLNIVNLNSKSRPYAVSINNIGAARGVQSGLQDAYIIYEMIVEGGLTRYLALFIDADVERIGSVRSARHYFLDYVLENDAIFVHHGQSPQAQSDFSRLNVDRIVVDNSKTGWRDKSLNLSSEHTLFTSTDKLASGIGSKRTERNKDYLLKYSVDPLDLSKIPESKEASSVSIKYSSSVTSSYDYDSTNKVYKRSVNQKAHVDYVSKEQYTFKNIIVYEVANNKISGDSSGRQNLNTVGSGTGYYISEGVALPITWSKSSRASATVYKYDSGDDLIVNDGNTFIQIMPKGQNLIIT